MVARRQASREAPGDLLRAEGREQVLEQRHGPGGQEGMAWQELRLDGGSRCQGTNTLLSLLLAGPLGQGAPDSWHLQGQSRMVRPGL